MFKGIWIGFSIAAPVGPIGILVLTQTLRYGSVAGLSSGLGAAIADLLYGLLAVAGFRLGPRHSCTLKFVGGLLLIALALRSLRQSPTITKSAAEPGRLAATGTTFFLTLSNPMTILSFAAMIASTGAEGPAHFVIGVFIGSMLWWTILSFTAVWLRPWIEHRGAWLNRFTAATLFCFGAWAVLNTCFCA